MREIFTLSIIKSFFINQYILLVNLKIINRKIKFGDFIKLVITSIVSTVIYVVLHELLDNILTIIIMYLIQLISLEAIIKDAKSSLFLTNLISNAIVYIAFTISVFIESPIMIKLNMSNSILNCILILIIESIMLIALFKIKRFKNGFLFLQNKTNNEFIDIVIINISTVIILAYYLYGHNDGSLVKQSTICFFILGTIMLIMVQKTLTLYYKQKLLSKTIEDYKSEIASKDEQIKKLSDEKFKISKLNHEFYNRQKALEKKVQDFVSNSNAEASSELSVMESINNLSKGYTEELEKIKSLDKLTSTDIEEIDDMFKYMQSECKNNNIDFKLQINGNIHHMVNKLIPQDRLVTLIGDHLRDAIIAINVGDNKFRSILAILGIKDECYELCIYDSGVEFTIDTLSKLGIEQITTHKDSGGSGMGFITTFETMKQTGASLIIDEKCKPSANDYTKAVIIRFDGKNEYRIFSYRSKEIKNKIKNNRAIIKDRM